MTHLLLAVEPRGLHAVPHSQRDPKVEREVEQAGFVRLAVTSAQLPAAPDDEPAQAPGAPIRTLQLLKLGPPTWYAQLFRAADGRSWALIERVDEHTWLSLLSLRDDGTLVRTIVQPFASPPLDNDTAAELISGPPLLPGFAEFVTELAGEPFANKFPDLPGVGLRQRVLPTGLAAAQARDAHQAHLTATATAAPTAEHTVEQYLAAARRALQINDVHEQAMSRWRTRTLGLMLAAGLATRLALFWALWPGDPPFWQAYLLTEVASRLPWSLLLRQRPRPLTLVGVVLLAALTTWTPVKLGVVTAAALLATIQRVVATPAVVGGSVLARRRARLTEPAIVPADRLTEVYR